MPDLGGQPTGTRKKRKFRFKNPLLSLDVSVIDLCATLFNWAKFRLTKGAVKLHLLLDHDGYLPSYAVITEGKKHEVCVARQMRFTPGTILVFDRGYTDFEWFASLIQQGDFAVGDSSECFSFVRDWVEKKVRGHLMRAREQTGFGWKRWSRQWLHRKLGLYKDYRLRRPWHY